MKNLLQIADKQLNQISLVWKQIIALTSLFIVGLLDRLTGYEFSISTFYIVPVAFSAWYVGRTNGTIMALFSAAISYIADFGLGHIYTSKLTPVWNALVRFGILFVAVNVLVMLRNTQFKLREIAMTDALTGLYGRREFDSRLQHDLALEQRRKGVLSIAYIDVDNFKAVNDKYGHAGGDIVLKTIAVVIKESLRATDTGARLGGDEFALVLPNTDDNIAQQVIKRFKHILAENSVIKEWGITCSVGVISFFALPKDLDEVVSTADQLMYKVKFGGKNAIEFSIVGETF